jgi:hypothetical protein
VLITCPDESGRVWEVKRVRSAAMRGSGFGEMALRVGRSGLPAALFGATLLVLALALPSGGRAEAFVDRSSYSSGLGPYQPMPPPPMLPPSPPAVGAPVVGKTVNVKLLSGMIGIKCKGDTEFRPLQGEEQIPVGCLVDARNGHVLLTSSKGTGRGTQTAEFWAGIFKVKQKVGSKPFTVLELVGPNASPSAAATRGGEATVARRRNRKLWGKGRGRFKSKGRRGAGSVRGTTWLVADIGDSTLCKVKQGKVSFRDFVLDRTVTVRAGETYVAKRRKR